MCCRCDNHTLDLIRFITSANNFRMFAPYRPSHQCANNTFQVFAAALEPDAQKARRSCMRGHANNRKVFFGAKTCSMRNPMRARGIYVYIYIMCKNSNKTYTIYSIYI